MRRGWIVLVMAMMLCTTTSAHAIVAGEPDGSRHPYVGMVFAVDPDGSVGVACSGTLISPRVVLTAGHCTETFLSPPPPFFALVSFAPDARNLVGQVTGTPHTYPGFCGGCGGAWGRNLGDIGVIVLDRPIQMAHYGQLPAVGTADGLAVNSPMTQVGYGVMSGQNGCVFYRCLPGDFGVRTMAPSNLLNAGSLGGAFVKLSQTGGSACFGDSGGPALIGDGPTIVGVHAYVTDWSCSSVSYATRIDQPSVLSWIRSWM